MPVVETLCDRLADELWAYAGARLTCGRLSGEQAGFRGQDPGVDHRADRCVRRRCTSSRRFFHGGLEGDFAA